MLSFQAKKKKETLTQIKVLLVYTLALQGIRKAGR